jgi:hypothetical protein
MKKIILGLLIVVANGFGQTTGANTVITQVLNSTNLTSSSGPRFICSTSSCPSGQTIQNISQTNHAVVLSITASSVASASSTIGLSISGSTDNVTFNAIGIQTFTLLNLIGATKNAQLKIFGYGTYPYLSITVNTNLQGSDTVTAGVIYVGNSVPINSLVDLNGTQNNMSSFVVNSLVGGATPTLINFPAVNASLLNPFINIYGLKVFSDSTGTVLTFSCSSTGSPIIDQFSSLGTNTFQIEQVSLRPHFSCPNIGGIFYTLTGTPVASMVLTYRIE